MKKNELVLAGLFFPFVLGLAYMVLGFFLVTANIILISIISIGFLVVWGYFGYEIGKEKGVCLKSIFYVHIASILLVALQVIVMIGNSVNSQYTPVFISQLFFLPATTLLFTLFYISVELAVILSFLVMIFVSLLGMFAGKRCNSSNTS